MKNSKITNGNPLPDEVEINLNMLGSLMLNRIGGHVDDDDVVTIHQRSVAKRGVELQEELAQPCSFYNSISHSVILSFSTRPRDGVLTLGGPGDEVITEEHSIARGGLACIRTAGPIKISVYDKISGGGRSQQKTQMKRALDIAKNALQSLKVRLPRIMHMNTDLLNGKAISGRVKVKY